MFLRDFFLAEQGNSGPVIPVRLQTNTLIKTQPIKKNIPLPNKCSEVKYFLSRQKLWVKKIENKVPIYLKNEMHIEQENFTRLL